MGIFDTFTGDGLLEGGANLVGGLLTNASNKREAQRNRNFQERMSSTAHQREVKDLVAAGLNPILSVNNGSSTPQGNTANQENPVGAAITSAIELKNLKLAAEKQGAEIGLINSQKHKTDVESEVAKRFIPEADFKNEIYKSVKPLFQKTIKAGQSAAKQIQQSDLTNSKKWRLP